MSIHLLVDFGSIYTKIIAVDLEKEIILGRAQSYTTVDTDITIGLNNALKNLINTYKIDENKIQGKYASSSDAGGKSKCLEKAQDHIGKAILPTPKATSQAAALLAGGHGDEPGIGSLVIVEIGGATTNVYSVFDLLHESAHMILKGLPELRIKRTIEGDLGIRYNAPIIYDFVGGDKFLHKWLTLDHMINKVEMEIGKLSDNAGSTPSTKSEFDADIALAECATSIAVQRHARTLRLQYSMMGEIEKHIKNLSDNVGYTPTTRSEFNVDIALAECAASIAVQRHAGIPGLAYSALGEIVMVQNGKKLLETKNIIGTGGIFKYGLHPERILRSVLYNPEKPWSLKPREPKAYVDYEYMLYGIGLLAEDFPVQALRIAKKYLKPTTIGTGDESFFPI